VNPVLLLTRNNLSLTKRCIESVRQQDIPVAIGVIDNGSRDGTCEWLSDQPDIQAAYFGSNKGVSHGWNVGLGMVFLAHEHCLVIGNDTVLGPWTYSALLSANVPFVTGVDVGMDPLPEKPDVLPLAPHPDFSCFLIRRSCWEAIGPFSEAMVNYCGDTDYHVRAHRLGIPLWKASVPYNHERSSTMNRALPDEQKALHAQAARDREVFRTLYGCLPGSKEYEQLFL
jgi:GT2 family glycosyltransferase